MRLLLLIFILLNINCANKTIYHIELAPQVEQYNYFSETGLDAFGSPVYSENENQGVGWNLGLIETSGYLFAKINLSQVKYTQLHSDGLGGTFEVDTDFTNFDLAFGLSLDFLKTYFISSSRVYSGADETERFFGAGLRAELPITESIKFSLDYNFKSRLYRDVNYTGPEDQVQTLYFGIMLGGWELRHKK